MTKPYILLRKTPFAAAVLFCLFSSPVVAQAESLECPKVEITSEKGMFSPKQKSKVKAQITGSLPEKSYLTWGTSVGKVVSGNGTKEIELFFERADQGQTVTVFLKVSGLRSPCVEAYSEFFPIASWPEGDPVDRFEDTVGISVKARVDNFIRLNENPSSGGLIKVYFNKNDSKAKRLGSLAKIFRAIRFRNYDASLVDFLVDETSGKTEFVFWIVPPGADLPGDRDKSNLIKGVDVIIDPRKPLPKHNCLCK